MAASTPNNDPIAEKIGDLEVKVALLDDRGRRIENTLERLANEISSIKEYATRWKGGFSTILMLGAAGSAILAGWDHIIKIFVSR